MRKVICALAAVLLLGLAGCARGSNGQGAVPTLAPLTGDGAVVAEGRVVPVRSAALGFTTGGLVAEVTVTDGAQVQAGQVLVRLDNKRAAAAVAQAEATLGRAQAGLAQLKAGARSQEVAAAQAAVDGANAVLQRLRQGPDENQLIAARADLANAQAAVNLAQAAYDPIKWQAGAGARPEALALQQASNTFDAAKARLDALSADPRPAEVAAAEADIHRAQAQLDLLKAGASPEAVAAAEADVATARAGLQQAQAALADLDLRAPFAGVVASVDAHAGEIVQPGVPLVQLGDLSTWQIDTDDLTELNVASIGVGTPATITLDALPDLTLSGKVVRIRPYGQQRQGDIVYTITIQPDKQDTRLRWNMTASVRLQPAH
jgi:HlyD family secretion protein